MSLYGSIRMAANTLRADQIALQVIGQNIANATTPGYVREEVLLSPAPTQRFGGLLLGMGVEVQAVVQKIDNFLEDRLRTAVSDRVSAETQEDTYVELEGLLNELTDSDLSTSLNNFFASVAEILNQPESVSIRNLAVLQAETLTYQISRLAGQVRQLRSQLNDRVSAIAGEINNLTEEIQTLNIRIAEMEGGDASSSDAVGLRDQRLEALEKLAELVDIRVEEQPSGGVAVYVGGLFLVSEGIQRPVEAIYGSDRGLSIADIYLAETGSPLNPSSGELQGLLTARDDILGGFLDELDDFAQTLIFEFNRIYSQGQGLVGYSELVSEAAVDDPTAALDQAGLDFTPVHGSFQVLIYNTETGLWKTSDIFVDLDGINDDTTLEDLAAALNAVDGLAAEVTAVNKLRITSESADQQFAFANDTSGVLAALGLNTFFTGSSAIEIAVNTTVADNPATFAASVSGVGVDTENAVRLAAFLDEPLESKDGVTLAVLYDRLISGATQGSAIARGAADSARVFEDSLRGQKLATSGVNIDEEAIRLIAYQRSFQAAARFIATLTELFGILVSL